MTGFAGADVEVAVVPPLVQELMARYDPRVTHYDSVAAAPERAWEILRPGGPS